jgi:tetratricopeptide (TPR) repeat protein
VNAVRRYPSLLLLVALGLVTALSACGSEDTAPLSDLDRFVQRHQNLPATAALDSLYPLAAGPVPDATFARYQIGNIYYALASDTARVRGWNDELARSLLDSAEVWFEAAIAADSTFVEALVNLGAVWDDRADIMATRPEREARIGQARIYYRRALELRPEDEKARCNLGGLYKRQNNLEAAMREFLTVLEYNPRSALARYNLAILFATMRIYKEALREFELAVKYDPRGDIGQRSRDNIEIIKDLMAGELAQPTRAR